MSVLNIQYSEFYSQALRDFLDSRKSDCFSCAYMNKWIRKRIRFLEGAKNTEQANQLDSANSPIGYN